MKHIVSQFRRLLYDNGQNDKHFVVEQFKLKAAVNRMIKAAQEVSRASIDLKDALIDKEPPVVH